MADVSIDYYCCCANVHEFALLHLLLLFRAPRMWLIPFRKCVEQINGYPEEGGGGASLWPCGFRDGFIQDHEQDAPNSKRFLVDGLS